MIDLLKKVSYGKEEEFGMMSISLMSCDGIDMDFILFVMLVINEFYKECVVGCLF